MRKTNGFRWIAIAMVIIFVSCIGSQSSFSQGEGENNAANSGMDADEGHNQIVIYKGYNKIDIDESLELYCDMDKGQFFVKDQESGAVWKSFLEESEVKSERKINAKWLKTMSALVVLYYTNYTASNFIPSSDQSVKMTCKKNKDRLAIEMDFTKQQIRLNMEVWLEDHALNVEIPYRSIQEYGQNGIMQIDILPFLLSAQKNDSGYMLYPDGCGALNYFKDVNQPYANKRYTFNLYSKSFDKLGPSSYDETDAEITSDLKDKMSNATTNSASMPVFGIKKNNSAVVGIIRKGDYNAQINVDPCGYAVDVNRVFPSMVYRSAYKDPRPDVAQLVTYYQQDYEKYDAHVKYIFLNGDKADYSGMANAYRETLLKEDGITPDAGKFSSALSFFCGIIQNRILFNKFIEATTFDQISVMLKDIGINKLIVNLKGSGENGYGMYNKCFIPAGALGGKKGFTKLMDDAKRSGSKIFIEENFIDILPQAKKTWGFNNLYIRDQNNVVISDKKFQQFIINPEASYNIFASSYIKKIAACKPDGITFDRMGELLYRDYSKERNTNLEMSIGTWRKFIELSKNSLGGSAVQGGNIYTLGKTDWIYEVPMKDSGCEINDEVIPFYQMVIHGLVDYSGMPGNLTHSFKDTRLQWAEYGCLPYFELTYSGTDEIIKTSYDRLYSSKYDIWASTVKATFNEFEKSLKKLQKEYILRHEKLNKDFVKVTYSNDTIIYINFGETECNRDGIVIPAMDYVVKD